VAGKQAGAGVTSKNALEDWTGQFREGQLFWALAILIAILAAQLAFKLIFLPDVPSAYFFLKMNPNILNSVAKTVHGDWAKLLFPFEYEPGRVYWCPSVIFFTYWGEVHLGPVASYLFFASVFVAVSFVLTLIVSRSLLFAATVAFMFAFGTQLDYVYTYGNLIALYLVLIYAGINFSIGFLLLSGRISGIGWKVAFVLTLAVLALANEMWINYATAVIAATVFGFLWARRHGEAGIASRSRFLLIATIGVLIVYLVVRMRFMSQFILPGSEEELLVTYKRHVTLVYDDAVSNFFTLLYMTIDNYFPSFISSSLSLTYSDPATIIAQQNGYDAPYSQLVLMNHLFLWRFYAGVFCTLFLAGAGWIGYRAWASPSYQNAIITALLLMTIFGFTTHLSIKMRPYNTVPALPYKVIFSVSVFTLLVGYLTTLGAQSLSSLRARRALVAGVWACVILAAFTRPGMQNALLTQVGLAGFGDPLQKTVHTLR